MKAPLVILPGRLIASSILLLTVAMTVATGLTQANPGSLQQLYDEGRVAYEAGDYETAVQKLGQVLESAPNDPRSRALYFRAQERLASDPGRSYQRQVAAIILPDINVEDVNLIEFLEYLQAKIQAAAEQEQGDEQAFVPNIILGRVREEAVDQIRFSLKMRHVPLDQVLRMAGNMAGVEFRYDKHAVIGTAVGEE